MGEQLKNGDLKQLQIVVNRYCLSLTGSKWDAEDLAQETWLKAVGTLEGNGHMNVEALLMRIAKNTWIDQVRRKITYEKIMKQEHSRLSSEEFAHTALHDHTWYEIEQALESIIKHLSPLQRAVFFLRDVFGYSSAEAAHMLHTTEGAIKASLHRARLALEKVRYELEQDDSILPEKERTRALLQSLATAYQQGDIVHLVQLLQIDGMTPAVVIGIAQNQIRSKSSREHKQHRTSSIQMVA
ncbi:RNA polymerase sigma factor [Paenibacillus sp. KN14-4R]|uniref:RNA polymerase sigma factor n=1 Tax=Paenibacillus sp. KN14-4R TaxID=3445773 RepID=UPI003FA030DB